MKKKDILQAVADIASEKISERNKCNIEISNKDVKDVIEAYFEVLLYKTISIGKDFKTGGFKTPIGTFSIKKLKPRKGKTPEGKDFSIGKREKLSFRQNKQSKDWIENGKLDITF